MSIEISHINESEYNEILQQAVALFHSARGTAAKTLSTISNMAYWSMGKLLNERKLEGKYGDGIVNRLSVDLKQHFPNMGTSPRNLWDMKRFYERFCRSDEKLRQAVAVLPWGHILRLMSKFDKDDDAILYYATETVAKGWNRDLLLNAIKMQMHLTHQTTAIGGKSATQVYEGERKFDLIVRYDRDHRSTPEQIGRILVPARDENMLPISELATIGTVTGPLIVYRENHERYCAVKFSVRDRDMGSAVDEARAAVGKAVKLPQGYRIEWSGDFENQKRASRRLAQVVPISLLLIFLILYLLFGNGRDAALVLTGVPAAAVGGLLMLWITGFNFSISAGIGFICLFGICIQNGVIMLSDIRRNLSTLNNPLSTCVQRAMHGRIRAILMTAMMATLGLLPAALSTGIGSESQRPLAIVIIGGLVTATLFILFVFPLLVERFYRRLLYDEKGALRQRKL